ncbi:MAG: uroporphyrinogen decarboxylase family protein [Candidatus Bathyarchaeia archaeon]|jgi:uroporphyrinogen decarboxylase
MKEPEAMTPRERIKNAMDFKKVDSIPWVEGLGEELIMNFISSGVPIQDVTAIEWGVCMDGFHLFNYPKVLGFDPYEYFGCINFTGCVVPVDIGPIPRFKQRKIGAGPRYDEYVTETGALCRRFSKGTKVPTWYSMPQFYDFPVKDRTSWEKYKTRLNPEDPRRYRKDWEKDAYMQVFEQYQGGPTTLGITGFYGFGAELMGITNFVTSFYTNPELMHDMVSHWEYFTIETLRSAVESLKDRIDMVYWWEDMAERHGPNISPNLYREFLLPHCKNVTSFLNKNKINRIMLDSDGNIQPLLDLIIEAGITGQWPLEVNAGMDVRTSRKLYGKKLFLGGNLDKEEIVKGGEAMRNEIDAKLPLMKETGGYFAGLDHDVPVSFTLERFHEYAAYLKNQLAM